MDLTLIIVACVVVLLASGFRVSPRRKVMRVRKFVDTDGRTVECDPHLLPWIRRRR